MTSVSEICGGHVFDCLLTERSGILTLLQQSDNVMTNRSFDIQDILAPLGVTLNVPLFMDQRPQLSPREVTETCHL